MPLSLKYRRPDNVLGWDGKVTAKTENRGQTPPHTYTMGRERCRGHVGWNIRKKPLKWPSGGGTKGDGFRWK